MADWFLPVTLLGNICLILYIIVMLPIRLAKARKDALESTKAFINLSGEQLSRNENEIKRLIKRVYKLEEDNQQHQRSELRQSIEISELERVISNYATGIGVIIKQLEDAGIAAMWVLPEDDDYRTYISNRVEREGFDRNSLFRKMDRHMRSGDIKELAFTLDVQYENISGTTKKEKIMGLIDFISRDNRIGEMMMTLRQIKSTVEW